LGPGAGAGGAEGGDFGVGWHGGDLLIYVCAGGCSRELRITNGWAGLGRGFVGE
jgi:hypothetical protein